MKSWKILLVAAILIGTGVFFGRHALHLGQPSLDQTSSVESLSTLPADQQAAAMKDGQLPAASTSSTTSSTTTSPSTTSSHPDSTAAATGATAPPASGAEKVAEKPKVENDCFVYEYQHKAAAKQKDIEDFMDFTNAFPILHKNYNAKTLCVKVNQQAVAFKLHQNKGQPEAIIGSVVGPESVIKVSYCTGNAGCKENCALPQKRFMDDLVSDASADEEFGDSWGDGSKSAEQKKQLHANVKAFRSVANENESLTKQSVMRDWMTLTHQESVCHKK